MLNKFSSLKPNDIAAWFFAACCYALCASAGALLQLRSSLPFMPQKPLASET